MRVLHLISSAGLYGAEKMMVTLCQALPVHGIEPTLEVFHNRHLPNTDVAEHARAHDVAVHMLSCRGRFDPAAVVRLRRDLRELRIDVVHAHGYKSNLYGFLASARSAVHFVSTCHRFDQGLRDTLDRPILRRADRVTAVSREAAQSLMSVYGLPAAQVVTIPNGVVVPEALPAPAFPPAPGTVVVGMAARLAPEKAPQDLMRAAALVHAECPQVRFLIAGDGPLMPELVQLRAQLGLTEVVALPGFAADMAAVYASLDVVVQPSYREGMPMTLLEAMAAGLPVVATRVGAAPDFVVDSRTGMLVAAGDVAGIAERIERLVTDPGLRRQIGGAARAEVVAKYSADEMARQYAQVYRSL